MVLFTAGLPYFHWPPTSAKVKNEWAGTTLSFTLSTTIRKILEAGPVVCNVAIRRTSNFPGCVLCLLTHCVYIHCLHFMLKGIPDIRLSSCCLLQGCVPSRVVFICVWIYLTSKAEMLLSASNSLSPLIFIPHPLFPWQFYVECDTGNNFISLVRRNR